MNHTPKHFSTSGAREAGARTPNAYDPKPEPQYDPDLDRLPCSTCGGETYHLDYCPVAEEVGEGQA